MIFVQQQQYDAIVFLGSIKIIDSWKRVYKNGVPFSVSANKVPVYCVGWWSLTNIDNIML